MAYATGTDVSIIRSIGELDKLLAKHGATGFAYGRDDHTARTRVMPSGRPRDLSAATQFADAEEKRRWRSLVLVVKALLVGVADGVINLSDAFLPYTVLPSGETVGEWAGPQLDTAYATAQMPELMPGSIPERRAIEQ